MVLFAIRTGLRLGEQMNLELSDLVVDGAHPEVVVRFGSHGKPPKNGKIRRVPLFGDGLVVAKRWLRILPSYASKNPHQLAMIGVTRPFRWHDLRHTCASALVSGWLGRGWSLEETKEFMGHVSRSSTERYAHMADNALRRPRLTAAVAAAALATRWLRARRRSARKCPKSLRWVGRDSNPGPTG